LPFGLIGFGSAIFFSAIGLVFSTGAFAKDFFTSGFLPSGCFGMAFFGCAFARDFWAGCFAVLTAGLPLDLSETLTDAFDVGFLANAFG
jgi:hypothetical protein